MPWVPYLTYSANSRLTSAQIKQKFDTAFAIAGDLKNNKLTAMFTNTTSSETFAGHSFDGYIKFKEHEVVQVGGYHNVFRPEAKIVFTDRAEETVHKVIIYPNLGMIIFIGVIVLYDLYAAYGLIRAVELGEKLTFSLVGVLLFPLFMFWVITSAFNNDFLEVQ